MYLKVMKIFTIRAEILLDINALQTNIVHNHFIEMTFFTRNLLSTKKKQNVGARKSVALP
jgi:hypothetical protein